jgi:hypothetical protein
MLSTTERELRLHLLQWHPPTCGIVCNPPQEERLGLGEAWMREQKTCQFPARISADSGHSRANGRERLLRP